MKKTRGGEKRKKLKTKTRNKQHPSSTVEKTYSSAHWTWTSRRDMNNSSNSSNVPCQPLPCNLTYPCRLADRNWYKLQMLDPQNHKWPLVLQNKRPALLVLFAKFTTCPFVTVYTFLDYLMVVTCAHCLAESFWPRLFRDNSSILLFPLNTYAGHKRGARNFGTRKERPDHEAR